MSGTPTYDIVFRGGRCGVRGKQTGAFLYGRAGRLGRRLGSAGKLPGISNRLPESAGKLPETSGKLPACLLKNLGKMLA